MLLQLPCHPSPQHPRRSGNTSGAAPRSTAGALSCAQAASADDRVAQAQLLLKRLDGTCLSDLPHTNPNAGGEIYWHFRVSDRMVGLAELLVAAVYRTTNRAVPRCGAVQLRSLRCTDWQLRGLAEGAEGADGVSQAGS